METWESSFETTDILEDFQRGRLACRREYEWGIRLQGVDGLFVVSTMAETESEKIVPTVPVLGGVQDPPDEFGTDRLQG